VSLEMVPQKKVHMLEMPQPEALEVCLEMVPQKKVLMLKMSQQEVCRESLVVFQHVDLDQLDGNKQPWPIDTENYQLALRAQYEAEQVC
jgi:hypothetical protein